MASPPWKTGAPTALYVHIPFCARRCPYCDFTTYAGRDADIEPYVVSLCEDIERSPWRNATIRTVFFGGGTPSYLDPQHLIRVLEAVHSTFRVEPSAEVSFEANPASADAAHFASLRRAGFTRVSLGVQSLDDRVLARLGRIHSAREALDAIHAALDGGFESVSVDLMFAVPGQALDSWVESLRTVSATGVHHVSTYSLTIEDGTPYARMVRAGELRVVSEDTAADMYTATQDILEAAGFLQYEISNFALPGHACRHNLTYWHHQPYLGFGAGAVSFVGGVRTAMVRDPRAYSARIRLGQSPAASSEHLTPVQALCERVMLGLRLREGLDLEQVATDYGLQLAARLAQSIQRQEEAGYLELDGQRLRLSRRGMLVADSVIADLLSGLD